jgi:hypothetical protein
MFFSRKTFSFQRAMAQSFYLNHQFTVKESMANLNS